MNPIFHPSIRPGRGRASARLLLAAGLLGAAALLHADPVGGSVISGQGLISQAGATTTVTQSSQNLSLNWQSFNLAPLETVNFVQPSAAAIAVNRISDPNGTLILGRINANGQVYLLNPNGILFGPDAQVNVGGLVASALDLDDASLNGSQRSFSGPGPGRITNQGTINATAGGYVVLLGPQVGNQGLITARLGTVALGAGSAATLTFSGDSLVNLQVDQSVLGSLAENGGVIRADGGQVLMTAGARDALLASVVNNTGVIEARTVENRPGNIVLLGGMTAGTVLDSGTIDADGAGTGQTGGTVQLLADRVGVYGGALINASGDTGGGTVLLGGDYQGTGTAPHATATFFSLDSTIKADAVNQGDGGKVILWSDGFTSAHGTIYARGGAQSGDGGLIETSGRQFLDATGVRGGAGAPAGQGGLWLFDPDSNILINGGTTTTVAGSPNFVPVANTTNILNTDINALLNAGTNVSVSTSNAGGTQVGNIVVAGDLINASGGARTLTLNSGTGGGLSGVGGSITVDANLAATGVGNSLAVNLINTTAGGGVTFTANGHITTAGGNILVQANTGGVLQDVASTLNSGAGAITIKSPTGITLGGSLTSASASGTAIVVQAGNGTAAGTATGGDITLSTGTLSLTGGGGAVLYTGNLSSTGVIAAAGGAGSGRFRYNSSPTTQNYSLTLNPTAVSAVFREAATLTVTPNAATKTYGMDDPAQSYQSIAGYINGDAATAGLTGAYARTTGESIGNYVITPGTAASNVGYTISFTGGKTLTIAPKAVDLVATRTYDGTANLTAGAFTPTISGTVANTSWSDWNGNVTTVVGAQTLTLAGTGTVADKNVGTAKPLTLGTLALGDGTNGGLAANYTFTGGTQTADITAAALTLGTGNVTKVYDGNLTAAGTAVVTAGTLFGGDTLSGGTFAFTNKNVGLGNKTVTTTGVTVADGNAGANYTVAYADNTTSTINAYAVALSGTRIYDGTANVAAGVLATGPLVGTETLTLAGTGTVADKNTGTAKPLTLGSLALGDGTNGGLAANYTFTGGTQTADITAAALTLGTGNVTKVYDGNLTAAGTAVVTAGTLFGGDTLSGGTFAFTNKNVGLGNKTVTTTGVTVADGNAGANYTVAYADNTTSTINAYAVALSGTRIYDGTANVAAGVLATGPLVGTETLTLAGTGTVADKNTGTAKPLTLGSLALGDGTNGGLAANYTFTGGTQTADITAAALTLGTGNVTKVYDGNLTAAGTAVVTAGTLFGGDTLSGGTFAFTNKNVGLGNKTVTTTGVTVADGNAGANYTVAYADNTTSTINAYAVALSGTRIYDGTANVAAGVLATGPLVGTETLTLAGTGTVADKNTGTAKPLTLGSLALGDGTNGGLAANYTFTGGTQTADITAAALTLGTGNVTKVYDGNLTAAGTAVVTAGTLFGGDTLSGGTFAFTNKNVGLGNKTVTTTGVTIADGNAGANYTVAYADNTTSTINAAALVIDAATDSRGYNGTTTSAGIVTFSGLQTGDTLTGLTQSYASQNVLGTSLSTLNVNGGYALADGNAGANYAVTFQAAAGTITPLLVTATVAAPNKVYNGDTIASPTLTITAGLVSTETLTATGTATFNTKDVATANLVTVNATTLANGLNGGLASNYTLGSGQTVAANITPRALTATVAASSKVYNGNTAAAPTLTITAGLVSTETLTATGTATFNTKDVATANLVTVNVTVLTNGLNGGLASNYTLGSGQTVAASITPQTVSLNGTRIYDGTANVAAGVLAYRSAWSAPRPHPRRHRHGGGQERRHRQAPHPGHARPRRRHQRRTRRQLHLHRRHADRRHHRGRPDPGHGQRHQGLRRQPHRRGHRGRHRRHALRRRHPQRRHLRLHQ
jgi:filamentous hemagglutinin family protein